MTDMKNLWVFNSNNGDGSTSAYVCENETVANGMAQVDDIVYGENHCDCVDRMGSVNTKEDLVKNIIDQIDDHSMVYEDQDPKWAERNKRLVKQLTELKKRVLAGEEITTEHAPEA